MTSSETKDVTIIEEQPNQEIQGVFHFTDASAGATDIVAPSTSVPRFYPTPNLEDMLCRVYPIKKVEWTPSDATGTMITGAFFPQALVENTFIHDKLKNFAFMRADVRIRLRINGTKFHYGKLLVAWSPTPSMVGDLYNRTDNLYSASGFPHVIVSPTENEVNELLIPFIWPNPFYRLDDMASDYWWGGIYVYVLNPLRIGSGTTNNVGVTLYANFENVHLDTPTATGVPVPIPQLPSYSSIGTGKRLLKKKKFPDLTSDPAVESQGKMINQSQEAERDTRAETGVVSSIADTVSTAAGVLSVVPVIGTVASIISTVAKGVGWVARLFGYQMPTDVRSIMPVVPRALYLAPTRGLDTGVSLGCDPENHVGSLYAEMGSHDMEMSIPWLISTPGLLATFVWSASDADNTRLFSTPVSPNVLHTDNNYLYPSILFHVSEMFKYWRGSIRYTLQVTCSQFHAGRLAISFDPYGAPTTFSNQCISEIIDVAGECEFHFSVPYCSQSTYLNNGDDMGSIGIYVVNPLTYTDSPVPDVEINVWVCGGPDMQYAFPSGQSLNVDYTADMFDIVPSAYLGLDRDVESQGLTREEMRNANYKPLIPGNTTMERGICMGEDIVNIKDLLMRYVEVYDQNSVPFGIVSSVFTSIKLLDKFDFITWLKYIYRFSRGGQNYKIYSVFPDMFQGDSVGDQKTMACPVIVPNFTGVTNTAPLMSTMTFKGAQICVSPTSSVLEVKIPYYSRFQFIPSSENQDVILRDNYVPAIYCHPGKETYVAQNVAMGIYRAVSDDYMMGFITGPPRYNIVIPPLP